MFDLASRFDELSKTTTELAKRDLSVLNEENYHYVDFEEVKDENKTDDLANALSVIQTKQNRVLSKGDSDIIDKLDETQESQHEEVIEDGKGQFLATITGKGTSYFVTPVPTSNEEEGQSDLS